jgi:multiple sugar transport system permease protein/sn-glycerol 3-phosphate transport system permease protein
MRNSLLIKAQARTGGRFLFLLLLSCAMAFPFLWMIITSFKAFNQVFILPPNFLPFPLHWSNYIAAWNSAPFGLYMFNSIFTTVVIVAIQLITSVLAAYAFARLKFRGKNVLFLIVLATMMVPIQVTFIPNFLVLHELGWLNSYMALIAPFSASAFGIFLLRQAFMQVPQELEEAARLDGCGPVGIVRHVMMPLSRSALLTLTLFNVIWHYNDFFWPLIATNSDQFRTLQVGLSSMISAEGGAQGTQWNLVMAASTIIILPLFILFIAVQKHIVKGISTTGIK